MIDCQSKQQYMYSLNLRNFFEWLTPLSKMSKRLEVMSVSKIQLVVYYKSCVLIG